MERLDFEKKFKKELDSYEIKPSFNSWEKLQTGLDRQEKSSKKYFWWMGIAASVVGVIFLVGIYFNAPPVPGTIEIVNFPTEKPVEEPKLPIKNTMVVSEEETDVQKDEILPKKTVKQETEKNIAVLPEREARKTFTENKTSDENKFINQEQEILPRKGTVTAAVKEIPVEVSDAEIEALLAEANKEISENNAYVNTNNISADDLLWEIETELDQSFREKVFLALKEGFIRTKDAVANRDF